MSNRGGWAEHDEERPLAEESLVDAFYRVFKQIVSALDVPFGYTLSIWASGQLAVSRYGQPDLGDVLLFVGGAVSAYILMGVLASLRSTVQGVRRGTGVTVLNVIALLVTVVVAAVASAVDFPPAGFYLTGLLATMIYSLLLTVLILIGTRVG
ncbi:MAG TPA: hypothetical protein VHS06_07780 [Chloroflexota bacterium]|nr:hypothetical protein [Chloroflexota bacterium]HEX2988052.1 hypothetical protein [Chloroflexota bacterium]